MRNSKARNQIIPAVIFLLPGFVLLGVFFIGPLLYSFRISFFDWNFAHPDRSVFVGFTNYLTQLKSQIFHRAVLNTAVYTVITVAIKMTLGFAIAVILNQSLRGRTFFRVAYYLPVITSWVIVSLLFTYMFSGMGGLVNYFLKDVLHAISKNIMWLADDILALVPVVLVDIWKGVGWATVIFLAGLQGIPSELLEAAQVDGANRWQRLMKIMLPMMRGTLVFLLVVLVLGGLNAYVPFQLITRGAPQDLTHSILTLMYRATFSRMDFGNGAAISYLLTIFVFVLSLVQLKLLRKPAGE
ncbi:MAG: sugar ABC transporter permease [Chloroflexi bacterium HGW-Chloroflexi-4]|jgi:multiple sugar transport system permease protein|nr:MAG: sugar ABC transporter permease [Chloroflexi bacterium HGW-Chloroflexi-4]